MIRRYEQRYEDFKFWVFFFPNFQGVLNWILQILHYRWSKQHKNIENLQFIEQNILLFISAFLSVYWDGTQ